MSQPLPGRGAVEHEGVDGGGPEVAERARERLLDLRLDGGTEVVRQPVVLAAAERELGLEEQLVARHENDRIDIFSMSGRQ